MKNKYIPIIDIFAGPGGLGEGFSSVVNDKGERCFKIALSVEMEKFAHETLTLRSFYRQFLYQKKPSVPKEYYQYLSGDISKDELFEKYPEEAQKAKNEAINAELGNEDKFHHETFFDKKIAEALTGKDDWVLIGGPPCQAYSLVGRARKTGGDEEVKKERLAKFEDDPKHTLYREYLRIIARHNPSVFVMENVKGILSSKLKGKYIFPQILKDLKHPKKAVKILWQGGEYHNAKYKILSFVCDKVKKHKDFIIRAEEYGVPQARHRVILLGVREDIFKKHKNKIRRLKKAAASVGVLSVIKDLPDLRSGLSKSKDGPKEWAKVLNSVIKQSWFKKLPLDLKDLKDELESIANIKQRPESRGSNNLKDKKAKPEYSWYVDDSLTAICNHEARGHIRKDIYRYIYVSAFGKNKGYSPKLADFPKQLLPNHKNIKEGVKDAKFADRFRVQIGDKPSTTVTCHISKDGHYFIHPDPAQARSLTVREAARLQTFPDNYFFEGPRTAQYQQVGNAVPPFLAKQLGDIVAGIFAENN
jgi:DNA (cytosine-5)-methyltransferase 1